MWTRLAVFGFLTLTASGQFLTERWNGNSDTYSVTVKSEAVRIATVNAGAPYSAVVIWQQVRTLADGTHIGWPPTVSNVWRDSQGRTRSEEGKPGQSERSGRFVLTEIWDPLGHIIYFLDDETRTAYRFTAAVGRRQPPLADSETRPQEASATKVTEKLGARNIEGAMAEGTRETRTIPTGAIGNDRPLVTTTEEWISPELKRPILIISSDPRIGNRSQRTIKISRAEPDASLFQPPAGYSIVEGKGLVTITLKRQ